MSNYEFTAKIIFYDKLWLRKIIVFQYANQDFRNLEIPACIEEWLSVLSSPSLLLLNIFERQIYEALSLVKAQI